MKFLILSTSTGQGHNSAAAALKESLESCGCEAAVMDVLKSGKKNVSDRVSGMYTSVTLHFPALFRFLYHLGEVVSSPRRRSPIYYLNALYAPELYQKIRAQKPDCIVCTHIFSAQAVTRVCERYGLKIPTAGVMTDYTWSPFWEETRLDAYIIPVPELTEEFASRGMPRGKLKPVCIPVRARYRRSGSKEEARRKLGFSEKPLLVLMGGSMGYGRILALALALRDGFPGAQIAVLCGGNKKLIRKLKEVKGIRSFEYTENVDVFMDAADVLLTKPGGLTSSEALAKRVPLVLTCPIPGCEEKNAALLHKLGAAAWAAGVPEAVREAKRLLENPADAEKMLRAQEEHFARENTEKAARFLMELAQTRP